LKTYSKEITKVIEINKKQKQHEKHRGIDFQKVKSIISQFRPGIPVNLNRIAELLSCSTSTVEFYLKMINQEMSEVGEYLELEQVFIRNFPKEENIEEVISSIQNRRIDDLIKKEKSIKCIYCEHEFDREKVGDNVECENCGKESPKCQICRVTMFAREDVVIESNCSKLFHKSHITAWLQSNRTCPNCKEDINERSLKQFVP